MTTEVLRTYRFRCDAAQCTTSMLSETTGVPAGWSEIDSIAHQSHAPLPSVKSGRARLKALDTRSIRSYGRFTLHLCPAHPDALVGHLPQTDNAGGQGASVFCSCGARLAGSTQDTKKVWVEHYMAVSEKAGSQPECGWSPIEMTPHCDFDPKCPTHGRTEGKR
ncbi:hypothetical protein [Streptomyces sp. NPDC005969]|uniref:hypothetical protein n=1 Tax=Streptomyces sp. NPDC005969 TaxID=3156722 RepID=UPI0033C48C6E